MGPTPDEVGRLHSLLKANNTSGAWSEIRVIFTTEFGVDR